MGRSIRVFVARHFPSAETVRPIALLLPLALALLFSAARPCHATVGQSIAYTYYRGNWSDIFTIDADSTKTAEITNEGISRFPSWSPDGSRLYYARTTGYPTLLPFNKLWAMRADGSNKVQLRTWPRNITSLDCSPDSRYLVIADYDDATSTRRLVRYDLLSAAMKTIYSRVGVSRIIDTDWTPDGRSVAFTINNDTAYRSYVVNASTGALSDAAVASAASVAWSRQSGRLGTRVRTSSGSFQMKIANGSSVSTIFSAQTLGGLSWAPDDSRIVFDGKRSSADYGLYTINPNGSGVKKLLGDYRYQYPKFVARNPEWRPTPTRDAAALTASVPSTCPYGGPLPLSFKLTDEAGAPLAGRTVVIQSSPDAATWDNNFSPKMTSADGVVTASGAPNRRRYYRAYFAGDSQFGLCISSAPRVIPAAYLSVPSTPGSIGDGVYFKATGYLKPHHAAGTSPVRLYFDRSERQSDGSYKWVVRRIANAKVSDYSSYSKYSATVSLPFAGRWRVRAYHPTDIDNASSYSGWRYLTVY